MKGAKPTTDQTSLKTVAAALFACRHAAREKGGGKGRKKREGEKGRSEGVPSYDSSVQGHTKKEGLPAMTKASSDTQARKGKSEREREKETGKRKEEEKEKGRRERGAPEYCIQEHPAKKNKEVRGGRGGGGRGLRSRQVPMNLEQALAAAAAATHAVPK